MAMQLRDFFAEQRVFTYQEFADFLNTQGSTNVKTRKALLDYHIKAGHLLRVRRGLYSAVSPGVDPQSAPVDAFLVASKMAQDAVLAYHTALDLYGKAHSVYEQFLYLTMYRRLARPLTFREYEFRGVLVQKALRDKGKELFGVTRLDRAGTWLRVTSLERTLVDLMDRPSLGGGWEEIWRSLESVEFFDIDEVVDYALLLENRTTVAKVGFYLESHRRELMVEQKHLNRLQKLRPRQRTYMVNASQDRKRTKHRLMRRWNLMIPETILEQSWEETF